MAEPYETQIDLGDEAADNAGTPRHHPEYDGAWIEAVRQSPRRAPYTDAELHELRVRYSPGNYDIAVDHQEAVVIWTLLDMIEAQKGWSKNG